MDTSGTSEVVTVNGPCTKTVSPFMAININKYRVFDEVQCMSVLCVFYHLYD